MCSIIYNDKHGIYKVDYKQLLTSWFPATVNLNSQSTMGLTEMVDIASYLTLQALGYLYSRKTKVRVKLNFLSGKITLSI